MEKALFVIENRMVTVEEMISLCGIEKTRKHLYRCEDARCRIKVQPSIPQKTKAARRKAPGAYFSRRSGSHHDNACRSGMKKGKNIPAVIEFLIPDKSIISSISEIPRRFIDDPPPLIYKSKIVRRRSRPRQDSDAPRYGRREKRYFFNRRTREVKTLVRVYETYSKKILQASPLHINHSPAKTFFNAFRNAKLLSSRFNKQNRQNRFVYFGRINGFKKVDGGLVIQLNERSRDEKPANIFLPKCSASVEQKKELWERIKKAAGDLGARVYALGSFQLAGDECFNLQVENLNSIWVSFPHDYANTRN